MPSGRGAQRVFAALLLSLLVPSAPAADTDELRIVPLRHRPAEEVIPLLRPLLNTDGRISGHQFQLFIRTSDRNFQDLERALAGIDVAAQALRVSLRLGRGDQHTDTRQQIGVDTAAGNARITVGTTGGNGEGVTYTRRGGDTAIDYRMERRTVSSAETAAPFVSVMDGGRAFIRVGQSVPQLQTFLALAGDRLQVVAGVQYHDVTTGFEVRPRLQGDRVWVEIAPRLVFQGSQGAQTVGFQELATTVVVARGAWVTLGGIDQATDSVTRAILAAQTSGGDDRAVFELRVD